MNSNLIQIGEKRLDIDHFHLFPILNDWYTQHKTTQYLRGLKWKKTIKTRIKKKIQMKK
jgi:hypothetical protein